MPRFPPASNTLPEITCAGAGTSAVAAGVTTAAVGAARRELVLIVSLADAAPLRLRVAMMSPAGALKGALEIDVGIEVAVEIGVDVGVVAGSRAANIGLALALDLEADGCGLVLR